MDEIEIFGVKMYAHKSGSDLHHVWSANCMRLHLNAFRFHDTWSLYVTHDINGTNEGIAFRVSGAKDLASLEAKWLADCQYWSPALSDMVMQLIGSPIGMDVEGHDAGDLRAEMALEDRR